MSSKITIIISLFIIIIGLIFYVLSKDKDDLSFKDDQNDELNHESLDKNRAKDVVKQKKEVAANLTISKPNTTRKIRHEKYAKLNFNKCPKNIQEYRTRVFRSLNRGSIEQIKKLYDDGLDLDITNNVRKTPLHAAVTNTKIDVLKFLLEHGADINANTMNEGTPLTLAIYRNKTEAAKVLIEYGADIHVMPRMKMPALYLAIKTANIEIFELLLQKGANTERVYLKKSALIMLNEWIERDAGKAEVYNRMKLLLKQYKKNI